MLSSSLTIPPAATLNAVAARTVVAAGARTVVPITFGADIVKGHVLNVLPAAAGSGTLLVQVLWGAGPIQGVDQTRLNDLALPAGSTETHFTGSQTTTHAPLVAAMAAQSITYTATLNGFAYSVFAIPVRAFTGQLTFSARIQGLLLYDPRLDSTVPGGSGSHRLATPSTWAYSDNPALADARWLWDTTFGCGKAVNWASVITSANSCDALIGSPAERRRVIGLTISQPARVADVAEAMRAYAGCWHLPSAAGITLVPDTTGTAVASYSHDAGTLLRLGPLVARDIGGAPTVVEVLWTDTSKRPVRDGTPGLASLPGAGTTLPYRLSQVRLPGIQRYSQAVREAVERLNKLNLGDLGTDVEVLDEGIRHEAGDLIALTAPIGLSAKVFRISATPEMVSRGRWRMPVVEYDPAMYSSSVATAPTVPDTLLINPAGPPPDVVVGAGGVTVSVVPGALRFAIPPRPVVDIEALEIRRGVSWAAGVRLEDGTAGSTSVDGTVYILAWPPVGSYTFWLRWRDRDGITSVNAVSTSIVVTSTALGIPYADVAGRPGTYRVSSRGASATTQPIEAGMRNGETGASLHTPARSYCFARIRRSDGVVVLTTQRDVFAGTAQADLLAGDLNATDAAHIAVVFTFDEPRTNRLHAPLATAMYRCGASPAVWGSPEFKLRAAYVLIGIGGCGTAQGYEAYQGLVDNDTSAWCDVAFQLQNGNLIVTGAGSTPRTLADYSYVGDLDATRGAPAGTLVAGQDAATLVATAASAAAQSAAATSAIAAITSDSILSQPEKPQIIVEVQRAQDEYAGIVALATARLITTELTAYTNAYNALTAYLATLTTPTAWNSMAGDTTIVGSTFRSNFSSYFGTRQTLLNRIEASVVGGGNIVRNASFNVDSNADGMPDAWAAYSAGSTGAVAYSRPTTGGADNGTHLQVTASALAAGGGNRAGVSGQQPINLPAAGGPVRMSAMVQASGSVTVAFFVECRNAANVVLAPASQTWAGPGFSWVPYSFGFTAPAGTTQIAYFIWMQNGTGGFSALLVDAVRVGPGAVDTAFAPRADELLPGVVGTTELADQAATGPFSEETFSVASGQTITGFTVLDSMTVSVATACRLELTLTGEGLNIYPDAGNSLSWSYRINGGAWVFLGGVPDGATIRRSVTLRRTIDPAPPGTYEFEFTANRLAGNPNPVIYFGQMMALQIKK
jgi:hypothetical protein